MDFIESIGTTDSEMLSEIITDYRLSDDELSLLFHTDNIHAALSPEALSNGYSRIQRELAAIFYMNKIDDNERLSAFIDELFARYRINSELLAKLVGLDKSDIDTFLESPDDLPEDRKFSLAIRTAFLLFLFSNRR